MASPEKATLYNEDEKETFTVLFNPNKYSIDKGVQWQEHKTPGLNLPELEFTQGDPQVLKFDLFLDTSRENTDVRDHTKKIQKLTQIYKAKHRPPIVVFTWASLKFRGVITSLSLSYTMFSSSGFPIRATVGISMKQFMTAAEQKSNTENESPDHTKVHTVRLGETIDSIAAREYDSPIHWKMIAEANDLEDPAALVPGQRLTLPRLF